MENIKTLTNFWLFDQAVVAFFKTAKPSSTCRCPSAEALNMPGSFLTYVPLAVKRCKCAGFLNRPLHETSMTVAGTGKSSCT